MKSFVDALTMLALLGAAVFLSLCGDALLAARMPPPPPEIPPLPGRVQYLDEASTERSSTAIDINEAEQVVGMRDGKAFFWSEATDMQPLPGYEAKAINRRGIIAGMDRGHAYLHTPDGHMTYLETPKETRSYVTDMNDAGMVAGYLNRYDPTTGTNDNDRFPCYWTPDGRLHRFSGPHDDSDRINNAGLIAGTHASRAAVWSLQSGWHVLEHEADYSSANAINDAGHVVGTLSVGSEVYGFYWTKETGIQRITLPGGQLFPVTLNNADQVLVMVRTRRGLWRACLWTPTTGLRDIAPPDDCNWRGYGLNDAGQVVGQVNDLRTGTFRSFLWTPK